jgi:long-chain acyl-CoA synthetase
MDTYIYDLIPKEEFEKVSYFPTIPEYLNWIVKEYAELPALSENGKITTYQEMGERIAKRRAFINGLGLNKGAKIAIFDRNSQDAIELFLAITSAGYVGIILPSALPEPAVIGSCMKFDVEAMFVRDEFKALTEKVPCPVYPASSMADEMAEVANVDKEDAAAIFFTGGTTGTPKGVVLAHRAIMRGAYNGIFAPGPQLRIHREIAILPLSHVFGSIRGTMGLLYKGGLLFTSDDVKASLGKIPMIKPTCLILVPGLCEILIGLAKMYGPQFLGGELKTIITGAANVPPRLQVEFEKLGVTLCAGYGMTETANLTTANGHVKDRPTSIGKLYPGQEAKIVDGELWVKGDNLFSGYYKDEANTKATLTEDGWIKTGDLAKVDEDGFYYIVGRIKNLIILANGENVSPETIEELFYKNPLVRDCLVSEGDNNGTPCIAIDILPQMAAFEGKEWDEVVATMQGIVDEINKTLPTYEQVAKVSVRKEDFKRTGSLKVARNQN